MSETTEEKLDTKMVREAFAQFMISPDQPQRLEEFKESFDRWLATQLATAKADALIEATLTTTPEKRKGFYNCIGGC
jgi:hypothetical protein